MVNAVDRALLHDAEQEHIKGKVAEICEIMFNTLRRNLPLLSDLEKCRKDNNQWYQKLKRTDVLCS